MTLRLKSVSVPNVLAFDAIGTTWRVSFESDRPSIIFEEKIHSLIEAFDKNYSRFRADSWVRSITESGDYIVPVDAQPLFDFYHRLYVSTGGLVTPLIGNLMSDAGYDADYSLIPGQLRSVPSWESALSYEHPILHVKQPVLLDFGAAGKGYLVDQVAGLLRSFGAQNYTINAGGDIYASGSERVGLENPVHTDEAIGVATIISQALCGSAGNRRAWANFTHIINPVTQMSPRHMCATWVAADTTMVADGLATALFFADPASLQKSFTFEYALVINSGELYSSPDFPAEFFTL